MQMLRFIIVLTLCLLSSFSFAFNKENRHFVTALTYPISNFMDVMVLVVR